MTTAIKIVDVTLEVVDPFQESINCLVVIAFPKSNSKNFAFALSVAEGASRYAITEIGGRQMHFAAFSKTQSDAGRASTLLRYVSTWKGVLIFSGGKLIPSSYQILQVIECFLESCSCRDSKAHCQTIIDDPFSETEQHLSMSISIRFDEQSSLKQQIVIDRYAFPCKYLQGWFRFENDHPSSPQDQIQAGGVRMGCDICPHFKPDDFKIVGTKTITKDFFD